MKLKVYLLFLIVPILNSCNSEEEIATISGSWNEIADFGDGIGRYGAVSFVIGNKAYVGLGSDYEYSYDYGEPLTSEGGLKDDFWEYNSESDTWTNLNDFPGGSRTEAIGFSINGKGYIGLGESDGSLMKDIWEYDPTSDSWTQLPDFPGQERSNPISFVINDIAYVGCGSNRKDFWEFLPSDNSWTQLANYPGEGYKVVGFSIDDKGYVGLGKNDLDTATDFWEYNPDTNVWKQKQNISLPDYYNSNGIDYDVTSSAFGFSVQNQGYVCLTNSGNAVWKYNPQKNEWTDLIEHFPGFNKLESKTGFIINGIAFLGTGLEVSICGNHCASSLASCKIFQFLP